MATVLTRRCACICVRVQVVAEQIPQLVQGVRGSQAQPDSPSAQLALISASQNFLQVGSGPPLTGTEGLSPSSSTSSSLVVASFWVNKASSDCK